MKALIVTDDARAIENISQVLETAGYDVITYQWLLKALDNIEEIAPHLIIISTKEYPRHWKTLAQFAETTFKTYKPEIILYSQGGLNQDELKKAETLKIRGIFESVDVKGLDVLRSIITKETDIYSGKLLDEAGNPVSIPKNETAPDFSHEDDEDGAKVEELSSSDEENAPAEISADETESSFDGESEDDKETELSCEEVSETENEEIPSDIDEKVLSSEEENDAAPDCETLSYDSETENTGDEKVPCISDILNDTEENSAEISAEQMSEYETLLEEINGAAKVLQCDAVFSNPKTGALITGEATDFNGRTFTFKADIPDFIGSLSKGDCVEHASLKQNDDFSTVRLFIREKFTEKLLLEIC